MTCAFKKKKYIYIIYILYICIAHQGKKQHGHKIARTDAFTGARKSVTVMTTTWSDGSPGPLGVSVPEGMLSSDTISDLNKTFMCRAFVLSSEQKSHFMTAETWLSMLKGMMTNAFAQQRKKLRLNHDAPGLLLCDGWTGFHSWRTGLDAARAAWSKANNVVQADTQPGGWSACGQPCDQLHHLLRARFDLVDAAEGGCTADLRNLMALFLCGYNTTFSIALHFRALCVYIYI